jgi:peptidoglycan/LPS O-acetylase OafA/YrhL
LGLIYWLKKVLDVQLFYLPIAILVVVILASCITFYIERPALKWIREYYRKFSYNNIK